ncbi:MAG TPA: helix-turn-helix transcriptional regulator [Dictyobacter sp.]|nr:helix-turn-helix transcriptional regulator [Dictyobacter sp.]
MTGHTKPTLLQLRRQTHITSARLAQAAGVTPGQAYAVEVGGFVSVEIAQRVLQTFNRLTHMHYTLHDIALHLTQHWQHTPPHTTTLYASVL